MIQVPYGQSHFSVDLPTQNLHRLELRPVNLHPDAVRALREEERLHKFRGRDTLCIVNDATRPTKTREIIEQCSLECDFIVATGAHAAPTPEELAFIFGPDFEDKRIFIHDARRSPCIYVGTTTRGTPVNFNSKLFDYKRILIIGSVEPHYFAGYTGGRKGLLPGVASYKTIEKNHALYFNPGATILNLTGNPVHEDMVEATKMLELPVLTVNMVMSATNEIINVFCGDLGKSFADAVALARSYYTVPITTQAEMVVTCAHYPMDVDLYQSHKAIYNATLATRTGGAIVLVSECRNGIGPRNFYDLMVTHKTPKNVLHYARNHYRLGYHKAASFAEALQDYRICVVSDLPDQVLHRIHLGTCTRDELKAELEGILVEDKEVAFMPQGSMTVPVVAATGDEGAQ